MDSRPLSLQLQSVIFNNDIENVEKLVDSLKQSAKIAIENGNLNQVIYKIGDGSPNPIIDDGEKWCNDLSDESISLSYEFFNSNLGHGGGQNRLAVNSDADIVGIINPDVIASPKLIDVLCNEFSDPAVGISEASQIPMEHPKDYDLTTRETTFASGCCLFIRREIFEEVGGFDDENFFMYCDDVDLSWRVRLLDKRIIFCPDACVYHDHRIGEKGELEVGQAEFYYSAIGSVMLAFKWGRKDIAEINIEHLRSNSSYKEVIKELDERISQGRIPESISDASKVAIFSPTGFADYRWTN